MSFDVKYDRDGRPVMPKLESLPEQQQAEQNVQTQPNVEENTPEIQPSSGLEAIAEDQQESKAAAESEVAPEPEKPTSPKLDKRLKVLMDKAQRMEHERNEAIQRIEKLEAAAKWKAETQMTHSEQTQDEDINLAPDDLAEGKHLSKMQQKLKRMEQALVAQQQQATTAIAQTKLRTKFPDFEKVVSAENVEVLKELHPEIYQTLSANNDLYSTGSSAYTIIKNLGIHVEDTYESDRAKVQQNAAKPKSLATISPQRGESPLSQANAFAQGLTPALQKQLIEEMNAARKGQ